MKVAKFAHQALPHLPQIFNTNLTAPSVPHGGQSGRSAFLARHPVIGGHVRDASGAVREDVLLLFDKLENPW